MILDDIVRRTREKLSRLKQSHSETELKKAAARAPWPRDFYQALADGGRPAVIAEIKRASPSAGLIRSRLDVGRVAAAYERAGAAAISVITEEDFFWGSLDYLQEARAAVSRPVLCKDFIVDPIQVLLARGAGADAVLLIAAVLTSRSLASLFHMARDLGMAGLIEIHDEQELSRALALEARIIGINNRDLRTLKVSLDTTFRLCRHIPPERLIVSESGIQHHSDLRALAAAGVQAVLVGTTLMQAPDPGERLLELIGSG